MAPWWPYVHFFWLNQQLWRPAPLPQFLFARYYISTGSSASYSTLSDIGITGKFALLE
jgi:hypothetical protein